MSEHLNFNTLVNDVENFFLKLFPQMTDIQKNAICPILERKNCLIIAPTGYGKTEAALIPSAFAIDKSKKGLKIIYITPLKALNRDMLKRFHYLKDLSLSYGVRHGDNTELEKKKLASLNPDILITTPETLQLILVNPNYDFSNLEYVIIDEIHELIDSKRGVQLSISLERLERKVRGKLTRIGLSATIFEKKSILSYLCGKNREGMIIESKRKKEIEIEVRSPSSFNKLIEEIAKLSNYKLIVFTNTREMAEIVASELSKKIDCRIHHGSLSKNVREEAEKDFKSRKVRCIVATSSLELGIDIGDVNLVVQIGSPKRREKLIQRAGRSNHFLEGISKCIIFSLSREDYEEAKAIVKFLYDNEMQKVLTNSYDVIAHQVLGYLAEKEIEKITSEGIKETYVSIHEIHEVFSKAFCYNLSIKKLAEIVYELSKNGLIFYDLKKGFLYSKFSGKLSYLKNCSFIPSHEQYELINITNGRKIAKLDYTFVQKLEIDDIFLTKGVSWRCLEIDTEKKIVKAIEEVMALAVPDWIGEDIPVDYEIAKEVSKSLNVEQFYLEYSKEDNLYILYTHLGTKKNRALEVCLRNSLHKLGFKVSSFSDAYRIVIHDNSLFLNHQKILEAMKKLNVTESIVNSNQYVNTITQVLKHFGMIQESKNLISFEYARSLSETIYGEEAINFCKYKYFDIEFRQELNNLISDLKVYDNLSRRTLEFIDFLGMNVYSSKSNENTHSDAISTLKENLDQREVHLRCTYCNNSWYCKIAYLDSVIKCKKCQSMMVEVNSLKDSEILVRVYGKRAVYALSTYGISVATAKRVLKKYFLDDRHFFFSLLQAQMQFIRTHKFWKA
ncbi:MAG: DEAD/DEAH box helicase [Candidatus Anstonellales archaeon]